MRGMPTLKLTIDGLPRFLKYCVENSTKKDLLANTYRQLGYAAEASTWRNFLVGAQELQNNVPLQNTSDPSDLLIHTPTERFLEAMATNLDGKFKK